ncbi:PREDICTED: xylosyltransferase oxt [Bactrocera latifrons]|uniref:protein xylosyltransferase n=1 Tax=Bactrocera latifrons TaxID=174628 RepID=A0A0K8W078_BACLA|nr:PREDICTED: xylosyltransferase oxt [Bactrocera latifrons]
MTEYIAFRWLRRYKLFFFVGLVILGVQIFLAYKSLNITSSNVIAANTNLFSANTAAATEYINYQTKKRSLNQGAGSQHSASSIGDTKVVKTDRKSDDANLRLTQTERFGIRPECKITSKEAISALQRAKTKDCRKQIAHIACAIQEGNFYAQNLPSYCPAGNHTANYLLGCYQDEKEYRLLSGYFTNFKTTNSPQKCIRLCLQSGFPYAGLQYATECFCGADAPPLSAKLPDSSCNMKCSGDPKRLCGGYFSMNVYETGIAKFNPHIADTKIFSPDTERVRIAFLLTLNGRALRQVHRLIKTLYSPDHVFYIHVDARQEYLYRKLLELESKFPNIRLGRKRFSTIWGGASLLTMLMQCMEDLLASEWQWDFVINLSESDFPVKTLDKLVTFLTANKDYNFVKSHGRETQRFVQKQGLDKTFVECDTHMWRIGDRELPNGIQIDGGSDWVALSRPFVHYVIKESPQDPLLQGLLTIFRHTLLPAESFFHTVLRNSHFCNRYIDNNLHVTNWKRKLGCKCQYKHVVDWCGCSPNDFKPEDWSRLQSTENKMLFFARKFEPIINQAVLLQLEEWLFGAHSKEIVNLHSYWQSLYDAVDPPTTGDDLLRTIGESLVRLAAQHTHTRPGRLLELTHYLHKDEYKGFLMRYELNEASHNRTQAFETRIRPAVYVKYAKNSKLAKRLRNFEVASDFDLKEQVARNFAKMLGPYTDLVLSFTLTGAGAAAQNDAAHSYNLTLLWIDPLGRLQDYNELHIEDSQTDAINYSKAVLNQPIMPGIWTAKLIGRSAIYAQTKFLVVPLTLSAGKSLKPERAKLVNGGAPPTLPDSFEMPAEWRQHLPVAMDEQRRQKEVSKALRYGEDLQAWVDDLVSKFFFMRETCAVDEQALQMKFAEQLSLHLCRETPWSSLAHDPKSDVYSLLKS